MQGFLFSIGQPPLSHEFLQIIRSSRTELFPGKTPYHEKSVTPNDKTLSPTEQTWAGQFESKLIEATSGTR